MEEYTVYFEDKNGDRRPIGTCTEEKSMHKVIDDFLQEHNYKSYYTQISLFKNELRIDVGSWSEFFYVDKKVLGL